MQKVSGHARAKSFCSCRCMARNSHPPSHDRGLGPDSVVIYITYIYLFIYIRIGIQEGCRKQKNVTIAAQDTEVRRRQRRYPGPKRDPHRGGRSKIQGGRSNLYKLDRRPGGPIQTHQGEVDPGYCKLDRPPRGVDPFCLNWIDPPVSWIDPPVSRDFSFKKVARKSFPGSLCGRTCPGAAAKERKGAEDQTLG